jgi:cytoskeletal protein RodZ
MDSTFGTRLRLQREEQQIPLATIAEQTKIKQSLLEGLERDDLSRWPTGIFRRSYFRSYARAIGLEPDRMMREFETLYPDPGATENVTEALVQARQLRRPPTRLRCLIDSAVNALPALHLQSSSRTALSEAKAETSPLHLSGGAPGPTSNVQNHASDQERTSAAPSAQASLASHPVEGRRDAWVRAEHIREERRPAEASEESSEALVETHSGVDFAAVAQLCTRLARALEVCDITPVLEETVRVLRAVGLTYLAPVAHDSDNAIASAFRTAEARVVDRGETATGAVVVPLLTPNGCAGVLALELRHGGERLECVRAAATILAAQLSTLVGAPVLAEAVSA